LLHSSGTCPARALRPVEAVFLEKDRTCNTRRLPRVFVFHAYWNSAFGIGSKEMNWDQNDHDSMALCVWKEPGRSKEAWRQ